MGIDLVAHKAMDALGDKLADGLVATFRKAVIERLSAYRAQLFYRALTSSFAEEQAEGVEFPETVAAIEVALAGELTSAMLFDCYRRVCFSRSKDLGPVIIGLLAGKLAAAERDASTDEEEVFGAAEEMTDRELLGVVDFSDLCTRELARLNSVYSRTEAGGVVIAMNQMLPGASPFGGNPARVGPVNLGTSFGAWARKAEALGIIVQDIMQEARIPNGPVVTSIPATQFVRHKMIFRPSLFVLAALVRRAHKVEPGH